MRALFHPEQGKRVPGTGATGQRAAAVSDVLGTAVGTLLAGGITIAKEGQALSKLIPQAGVASREARKSEEKRPCIAPRTKGKTPGYQQVSPKKYKI